LAEVDDDGFSASDFLVDDEETADTGAPLEGDLLFAAEEDAAAKLPLIDDEDGEFALGDSTESFDFTADEFVTPAESAGADEDLVFADAEDVSAEQPIF